MSQESSGDEMRDEYDFRGGVRGKYHAGYSAKVLVTVIPNPWTYSTTTESCGTHAEQSTVRVGGELLYQSPQVQVGDAR